MNYAGTPRYALNFLKETADFFLPRICPSCNNNLAPNEKFVCAACLSRIERASTERILHEYERKFADKKIISGFVPCFVFEKDKELQHIIHALKYNGMYRYGIYLGTIMGQLQQHVFTGWGINLIVPVPLHYMKKSERGYNQSSYIAKGLGRSLNIPVAARVIKRIKYTESQTKKNLIEREANMEGAFAVKNKKLIAGKTILLIDDVITTGATISACGNVLLESGANEIYAASVAVAD